MKKFAIIDDHAIVREGLDSLLSENYEDCTIITYESASEYKKIMNEESFDLLILDVKLADESAFTFIPTILDSKPKQKILVFSMYPEQTVAKALFNLGIYGYVNKEENNQILLGAIKSILKGEQYISEELQRFYAKSFIGGEDLGNPLDRLSTRELQVLMLLIGGDGILEIANKLDLSSSTIGTYKDRVFNKMKVSNIIELYNKCLALGIV